MPFKYIVKWNRGETERISVEAWNRYPLEKPEKPAFLIGSVSGNKALLLRERVQAVIDSYGSRRYGSTLRVEIPLDDTNAIAEAYRIGLAAAVLTHAPSDEAMRVASRYVLKASNEEIWFWTSKLLDSEVGPQKTISALCIVSGNWEVPRRGKKIHIRIPAPQQVNLAQFDYSRHQDARGSIVDKSG